MSLLDDAKRLADESPTVAIESGDWRCAFCLVDSWSDQDHHASDCLWLAMPRIIAALEAADAFVNIALSGDRLPQVRLAGRESFAALAATMRGDTE